MIDRVAFEIFGFSVYWYGIIIAFGCFLGVFISCKRSEKYGYSSDNIMDALFWVLPLGLVCARAYYVIFEWGYYSSNPEKIFAIRDGGIAIYGGIIGGLIGLWLFKKFYKKQQLSFLRLCDIVAPGLAIAQSVGRWGNFVNQEAYSSFIAPDWMRFPLAVYIEAIGEWRLATFFYESVWNLFVFGALMWYSKKEHKNGNVTLLYMVLYGFGRMFIEGLRADSLWLIPGYIRVSQLLSGLLVVGGLTLLYYRNRKNEDLKKNGL
ncbi:MAG: prolipoprotein diacylglyceryl transferase [Lachnospiraceae bacterium]|nr:prolipoprotein diacylglyceryl transferase [Lachnospiraceae bacterium]